MNMTGTKSDRVEAPRETGRTSPEICEIPGLESRISTGHGLGLVWKPLGLGKVMRKGFLEGTEKFLPTTHLVIEFTFLIGCEKGQAGQFEQVCIALIGLHA